MRRTKEQAALTRQTILDAAEQLFLERGYDHVSLDQIAEAAGVKRGAVHFHFLNKPGLLLTVCEQDRARLQSLVERLEREPAAVPLDELFAIISETLNAQQGDDGRRAMTRAFLTMGLKLSDEERSAFLEFQRRLLAVLTAIFAAAAARGQLASYWNPGSAATALYAMMSGLMISWAMGDTEIQLSPGGVEAMRGLVQAFRA